MVCLEKMETHQSAEQAGGGKRKASFNATPSHTLLYLPSRGPDNKRSRQNRQLGNSALFPSAASLRQGPRWKVPRAPPPASWSDPADMVLWSTSPEVSEGSTGLPITSDHFSPSCRATAAQSLAIGTAELCPAGKQGEKLVSI